MKINKLVLSLAVLILGFGPALATPQNLAIYTKHPKAKSSKGTCALCHVNPSGGGTRNDFGQEFEKTHSITDDLIAKFPKNFSGGDDGGSAKAPVLANVNFVVTGGELTTAEGGTLSITISGTPDNLPEDNKVGYSIKVKKKVTKFVEFSKLEGEITFDEAGAASTDTIELSPGSKLTSPKVMKKLAKKPLLAKGLVVAKDPASGKLLKKEKEKFVATVTLAEEESADEEGGEEEVTE